MLANGELEQALRQLDSLDPRAQRVVSRLAHRITTRLLHTPTERLKARAARGGDEGYLLLVRDLFDLEPLPTPRA